MTRDEALKLLKLDNSVVALTPEIVREAFHRAMLEYHPDTAKGAAKEAGVAFQPAVYQKARKMLLDHLTGDDFACKLCNGTGKVAARFGRVKCVACRGTGDRQ